MQQDTEQESEEMTLKPIVKEPDAAQAAVSGEKSAVSAEGLSGPTHGPEIA